MTRRTSPVSTVRQMPKGLWMDSDRVVSTSLQRLGGRRAVCVPGIRNKVLAGLFGFGPIRALAGRVVHKKSDSPQDPHQPVDRTDRPVSS